MEPGVKVVLEKRLGAKRIRLSNSADDVRLPETIAALANMAITTGGSAGAPSSSMATNQREQQELLAARASLQRRLEKAATSAAATAAILVKQHETAKKVAAASAAAASHIPAAAPTPAAAAAVKPENEEVAGGEGKKKKRRKKKKNKRNKKKEGEEAESNVPENTEKEEDPEEGQSGESADVADKPSDRRELSDKKTTVVAPTAAEKAPKQNPVRHPANPVTYTSNLHYIDAKTGKLIPEKIANMGYQDRRRIYADFLVARVMMHHPALYDDIMNYMYQMPDKQIVQMIYDEELLGEFSLACIHDLQKVNYKLKKRTK